MSLRSTILEQIRAVAAEQDKTIAPLSDDLPLLESGLDSLCFAILIARLEDLTGQDPFNAGGVSRFPRTVGDLVLFYEETLV
jgi:aryl carrier-like protein